VVQPSREGVTLPATLRECRHAAEKILTPAIGPASDKIGAESGRGLGGSSAHRQAGSPSPRSALFAESVWWCLMTSPDLESIRSTLTKAEDAVRDSSRRRYHQGRTATPLEKIKVLEDAFIELCSVLSDVIDHIEK
jgi:hypothetical protein